MVIDVVRTYLDAASGFTELTRKRAVAAARTLLRDAPRETSGDSGAPGPDTQPGTRPGGRGIQELAAELVEASETNRARLTELISEEVRRQLQQQDLVSRAEYERVLRRVADLERRLAARTAGQVRHVALQPAVVSAAPAEASLVAHTEALRAPDPVPSATAGRTGDVAPATRSSTVESTGGTPAAPGPAGHTEAGDQPAGAPQQGESEAQEAAAPAGAASAPGSGEQSTPAGSAEPLAEREDGAPAEAAAPGAAGEADHAASTAKSPGGSGTKQGKRASTGKSRSTKGKSTSTTGRTRSTKGTGKRGGQSSSGPEGGTGATRDDAAT